LTGDVNKVNNTLFYLSKMTGVDEIPSIEKQPNTKDLNNED